MCVAFCRQLDMALSKTGPKVLKIAFLLSLSLALPNAYAATCDELLAAAEAQKKATTEFSNRDYYDRDSVDDARKLAQGLVALVEEMDDAILADTLQPEEVKQLAEIVPTLFESIAYAFAERTVRQNDLVFFEGSNVPFRGHHTKCNLPIFPPQGQSFVHSRSLAKDSAFVTIGCLLSALGPILPFTKIDYLAFTPILLVFSPILVVSGWFISGIYLFEIFSKENSRSRRAYRQEEKIALRNEIRRVFWNEIQLLDPEGFKKNQNVAIWLRRHGKSLKTKLLRLAPSPEQRQLDAMISTKLPLPEPDK